MFNSTRLVLSTLLFLAVPAAAAAQEHEGHPAPPDTAAQEERPAEPAPDHADHAPAQGGHGMAPGVLGEARSREGSGTAWLPDASPMYALHSQAGGWETMLHGSVFLQYVAEGGDRGDDQLGATSWLMGMARRPWAGGALTLRAMGSLDPATVGECGYPDLLATGETCEGGRPIHDRQHPHDAIMELGALYERALSPGTAFQLYGALAGEPALGPVAYPHRISAMALPLAPITHHWLDATHIAFGVATAGVYSARWKVEASVFNGREPDEERWDLDLAALDSWSGRLAILPSERWALQVSTGRLAEAEVGHGPGDERVDVERTTASAIHHRPRPDGGVWATTLAWGRNVEDGEATYAILLESSLNLGERQVAFARVEAAEKSAEDLALDEALHGRMFRVGKVVAGYVRRWGPVAGWNPGIGGGVSIGLVPEDLEPFYGGRAPVGAFVYLTLRPASMGAGGTEEGGAR
ncbi:MAG TPA: hypothetical protein VM778_12905 [Gemmatimonadota bacterium]|nr:hypothetical protein [Gemmatimonadota bacterium]